MPMSLVYSSLIYSHSRHAPWPSVTQFLEGLPQGSLFLDVGCGNSKYITDCNKQSHLAIGCDRSLPLLAQRRIVGSEESLGAMNDSTAANNNSYSACTLGCDATHLPYRSDIFDGVICIAVLHHLSTTERRVQALAEMVRVCRTGESNSFFRNIFLTCASDSCTCGNCFGQVQRYSCRYGQWSKRKVQSGASSSKMR
jgi:alkylated DNA repair protein alkB family protein 8